MKQIHYLFSGIAFLVLAFCLTSCEEEVPSVGAGNPAAMIVGTWQCTTADFGTLSPDIAGIINTGNEISFNADGTYYLNSKKVKQSQATGKWSINGNTLKVTSGDNSINLTFTITELTDAKLSFYLSMFGYTLSYIFDKKTNQ